MGLADLHIHTTYSWDGTSSVPTVLKKAAEVGLDVIAITDHDEIRGGFEALELASTYQIGVIPGCEVSTADGHLLALFIQQRIPKGLSLAQTLGRVADQGGCCIAAHPAARWTNSLTPKAILNALQDPALALVLVGIEVFNSGLFHQGSNPVAQKLASSLSVAQVGNSDAHISWMIGNGATAFDGTSVHNLRHALETGKTEVVRRRLTPRLYIVGDWISRYISRQASSLRWNAGPDGSPALDASGAFQE